MWLDYPNLDQLFGVPPPCDGPHAGDVVQGPNCRQCNGDCVQTAEDAAVACPGGEDSPDQFITADCMGCHGNYAPQNSSFIFSHRPCCVRKDGTLPNTCGNLLEMDVCAAESTCMWFSSDPDCS